MNVFTRSDDTPSAFRIAALSTAAALAFSSTAYAESACHPSAPSSGLSYAKSVRTNPKRAELAKAAEVVAVNASEVAESGTFRHRSFGEGWICNYFVTKTETGELRQATARHCVGNDTFVVSEDYFDRPESEGLWHRVRVIRRVEKILELGSVPEEGETVTVMGCIPESGGCFRISGKYAELYRSGEEGVRGIWMDSEQYGAITGGRAAEVLSGLSWAPAVSSDGKAFGTVSATLFSDYRKKPEGECLPGTYAVVLAVPPTEKGDSAEK